MHEQNRVCEIDKEKGTDKLISPLFKNRQNFLMKNIGPGWIILIIMCHKRNLPEIV